MNRYSCDQEPKVQAALRSGAWEMELRNHVKDCPLCADVLMVTEFLRQEAEAARLEPALPSAGFLWWKSQLLARQKAVSQATRPIAFARNLAYVFCGVALLWFLFGPAQAHGWMTEILKDEIHSQAAWTGDWRDVALLSLGGAALTTILASFYMAWIER
jgi:hypothetical protein